MELRGERFRATFLDPRRGFERTSVELEVRRDPLTGRVCRLLPDGTIPPPARHDLEALARETRESCPFCGDALERETPRLPPEVSAEGRIRNGEATLFPNLVPYAPWASVSVYSPGRHHLPIEELTPELIANNLATQVVFARGVLAHDPESTWISINANHLPPSGSSIFHPHLQGAAAPFPSTAQRALAELDARRLHEYVELERRGGERLIADMGDVVWLAPFAPVGIGDVRAFVGASSSPAELDDPSALARGIARVLGVYADLGFESFNLALYGAPGRPLTLQMVARAYFGAAARSDVMWSERLHGDLATDLAPERLAALVRARVLP